MSEAIGPVGTIVELGPSDAAELAAFPVRRAGAPWTVPVADGIREAASHLGTFFSAIGLRSDGELRAVAIWRVPSLYDETLPSWELSYLATHASYPRRGYARRTKIEVLRRARAAGIVRVLSYVSWDNVPMLRLNESLLARRARIPDNDDYAMCVCMVDESLAAIDA